jgi:hypothetical protein
MTNTKCKSCEKCASFAHVGEWQQYCATHKMPGMVNVTIKHNLCKHPGCPKLSSYAFQGEKRQFCLDHKQSGMVDVVHLRCTKCNTRPSFGYEQGRPLCCVAHKEKDMEDVVTKTICQDINCKKHAIFGYEPKKPLKCVQHKAGDMIDVKNRMCKYVNCSIRPSFGFPSGVAEYCVTHKTEGMLDLYKRHCLHPGCNVSPTYGYNGTNKSLFCSEHKLKDMIVTHGKKCEHCGKKPSYGYEIGNPLRCFTHKTDDMKDVIHKRCIMCDTVASFGIEGGKKTHCSQHKTDAMLNLSSRYCSYDGCNVHPSYGYIDTKTRLYCKKHALDDMVSITLQKCILCPTSATLPKYRGYCMRCFVYTFPDEPVSRNYRIKEKHFTDWVRQEFTNMNIQINQTINGGCSKRRPDVFIDMLTHSIIMEFDENQHEDYDTTCEVVRINELYTDLADRPIVFIRFNPDEYNDNEGNFYKSCFKYIQSGIPVIESQEEWEKRLMKVKNVVNQNILYVPDEPITIIYLYYEGFDKTI